MADKINNSSEFLFLVDAYKHNIMQGSERIIALVLFQLKTRPYLKVIRGRAPRARNILDRLHIATQVNKAIDQVRAHEPRKLCRQGLQPTLKGTRWLLLKNREKLSPEQDPGLADLLKQNLTAVEVCLLEEGLKRFREHSAADYAGCFLSRRYDNAINFGIAPMQKVVCLLRRHHDLMLNWFRAKKTISSGPAGGLNNKAKQALKKAYGYRSMESMKNALYHDPGYLPMPHGAH